MKSNWSDDLLGAAGRRLRTGRAPGATQRSDKSHDSKLSSAATLWSCWCTTTYFWIERHNEAEQLARIKISGHTVEQELHFLLFNSQNTFHCRSISLIWTVCISTKHPHHILYDYITCTRQTLCPVVPATWTQFVIMLVNIQIWSAFADSD